MESKIVSLSEAISRIKSGALVGLGGMTIHRRPMAACREIIRQGIKNLTALSCYGGLAEDLLIGSGAVSTVRCGYLGLEAFGLAPNFRRLASEGKLNIVEEGEFTILLGLRAALLNTTFIPARTLFWGSDQLKYRPDIKQFQCPLTNERLLAVPAIKPDVALIHVQKADHFGNAFTIGQLSLDVEMAYAAKTTILTAEEIMDPNEKTVSSGPGIIQNVVDCVVKVPFGALPTSCHNYYNLDVPQILRYLNISRNQESFDQYIREFVQGPKANEEYVRKSVSSITGVIAQ